MMLNFLKNCMKAIQQPWFTFDVPPDALREAMRDAVYEDNIPEVIRLAQEGAPLNAHFWVQEPDTPITYAAFHGQFDMIKTLLELGADINGRGEGRWTALMKATSRGRLEIVQYLLENGADATLTSKNGETSPRHL